MAETRDAIFERLLGNVADRYDKTVGSFVYDTQMPLAIEAELMYNRIEEIVSRAFVQTATGEYLDAKLNEVGLSRIHATYAAGTVQITGTPGTVIPLGTKVKSDVMIFTIDEEKVIPANGTAEVTAVCDEAGANGNVPAEAINSFAITVPGLTSVINQSAFAGGYDEETDEEARERYLNMAKRPPTSGNKSHYEEWAREASPGVGYAKCIPLWDGPGTVKVVIVDDNMQAASSELVETVAAHIEQERPIGADVTVESATPLTVNIAVTLVLQDGYETSEITSEVESVTTAYLKDLAFSQNYVSIAQIGRFILQIDGVLDYSNLTVNSGTVNIEIDEDEVPVLGSVTIDV